MKKILGIGNALVDILVKLQNDEPLRKLNLPKGSMQLIDQTTMQRIAEATSTYTQHTATGGSASNTIVALAQLGCHVGFIGKVGHDNLGSFYSDDLTYNGVTPHLLKSDLHSGRCNVLISNDSERTMATYLGAAVTLNAEDLDINIFRQYDILHIEGYLVQNYTLITRAAQLAKEAGLTISIDLASYNIVAENIDFLQDFVSKYVDIVFANEDEATAFTNQPAEQAVHTLAQQTSLAIVKVGAKGSYIKQANTLFHIPAEKVKPIDTTGAGDIYAAGFLYGYANNLPLNRCAEIGTLCAGHVIEEIGAKITPERWQKIHDKLKIES
jgi:sugar/nucleoside kinase (ribokinase family)